MPTVVITGAGRGIGLALAAHYHAAGWTVFATLRDPAQRVGLDGVAAGIFTLDIGSDASVAAFAHAFGDRSVDLLINNAGLNGAKASAAEWQDFPGFLEQLNVNTVGPLRLTRALLPNLRRARGARIAIISSRMGSMSYAKSDTIAYRASKAAVNKVAQGLATDLKPEGIAVVSLHPGWVRTDMGGGGADIDPATSAAGIARVIAGLTPERTGQFLNYDGTPIPW